jgi:hypothetical protein
MGPTFVWNLVAVITTIMPVLSPPALLDAIEKAPLYNPAERRSVFDGDVDLWKLYQDLTELDQKKLAALVEKHHEKEPEAKYALRQKVAVVFNLVPSILGMIRRYLFGEEPVFDVNDDPDLTSFLHDCDGNGTKFTRYVRDRVLQQAMTFGFVDVLVQNPATSVEVRTEADRAAADLRPRLFTVTPIRRMNWSCQPNDAYNWVTFKDLANERKNPFGAPVDARLAESYIMLGVAGTIDGAGVDADKAVWVRSSLDNRSKSIWSHEAGYFPTSRVPVATLYYTKSNDDDRRHYGLSKIAIMAILTKGIIQVLSWTHEDILANLALYCFPSSGGKVPTKEDGTEKISDFTAFTVLWFDKDAKLGPSVLQGNVSHIEIKLKLVEMYVREILRLSHLGGVSGDNQGKEQSGWHAVVNRTELFQELIDLAGALDDFAIDTFALVKSMSSGEDWTRQRVIDELKVQAIWYKGPYTIEPVEQILKDAGAAIQMFRDVSPTMVENQFKRTARAVLYQDDPDLPAVVEEIEANSGKALENIRSAALIAEATAINQGSSYLQTKVDDPANVAATAAGDDESSTET